MAKNAAPDHQLRAISNPLPLLQLMGLDVTDAEPLDRELTASLRRNVDWLARCRLASTGEPMLVQVEFQSRTDITMLSRMYAYSALLYRRYQQLPLQYVVYLGEKPWTAPVHVAGADSSHAYRLISLHSMAPEPFLASSNWEIVLLALLCRTANPGKLADAITERLVELNENHRISELQLAHLNDLVILRNKSFRTSVSNSIKSNMIKLTQKRLRGTPLFMIGKEEGMEIGELKGRYQTILLFLKNGMSAEEVVSYTNTDLQTVLKLQSGELNPEHLDVHE